MKVFLFGSRNISCLPLLIKVKLDSLISRQVQFLIGDADGVDKEFQKYLFEKNYSDVSIFHVSKNPRNLLNKDWKINRIDFDNKKYRNGFEFYIQKDIVMCKEANMGICVWDEKSRGTLRNISQLMKEEKEILVYSNIRGNFIFMKNYFSEK